MIKPLQSKPIDGEALDEGYRHGFLGVHPKDLDDEDYMSGHRLGQTDGYLHRLQMVEFNKHVDPLK